MLMINLRTISIIVLVDEGTLNAGTSTGRPNMVSVVVAMPSASSQ